ncbi:MAG: hypothetical protein HQ517_00880, partial [SAR324 cluster bacterium]|nr:hypothetical protein [SAR324 cluster bacterium]
MKKAKKNKKLIPIILFCFIFTISSYCYAQQGRLEYAQEIPIKLSYGRFPDKDGEDIAPHILGNWRMYKPNPITYNERKNRPSQSQTLYHGGRYTHPGYQPKKGGFHLVNSFGVWQHDPNTDYLNYKFTWPFERVSNYDKAHNCYFLLEGTLFTRFSIDCNSKIIDLHLYEHSLDRYIFTDKDGVL